jgi:hypothetical protein
MNGWRIDPEAANAAVADAKGRLAGMDVVASTVQSAIDGASKVVGPKTAAALAILAKDPFQIQIDNVTAKVTNVTQQATEALAAYEQGDQEMATNSSRGYGR